MRYWLDGDCLAVYFFLYWGLGDGSTTLAGVMLAGIKHEMNPIVEEMIAVSPAVFLILKIVAGAVLAYLIWRYSRFRAVRVVGAAYTLGAVLIVILNLYSILLLA